MAMPEMRIGRRLDTEHEVVGPAARDRADVGMGDEMDAVTLPARRVAPRDWFEVRARAT